MAADEEAHAGADEEQEPVQGAVTALTEREREVLRLLAEGKTNSVIAWLLHITPHTAKAHVASIRRKLGVSSRTEAAVMWIKAQHGWTTPDDE
jgi:DNA-binding CsgD family transcriptional regulator